MNNLLITYDLHFSGQDYQALIEKIQSLGQAKSILKSVWVLKTSLSADVVRKSLQTVMDKNDFIFVCRFDEWSAFMLEESNQFISGA
ncbi:hypothetical protein [Neisseria shayeganii]|uniref:CRISPR-associated protein Cas2 n=1 Tax=Neisseria shayeganii TaxID=607712 RepID=A0A7D7N705_9NEIS|nr:hypothetical protein [Neisseria shayeganii]QMT41263.1 hypothetical protein H3L94_04345 [Neisseria shayeganii]